MVRTTFITCCKQNSSKSFTFIRFTNDFILYVLILRYYLTKSEINIQRDSEKAITFLGMIQGYIFKFEIILWKYRHSCYLFGVGILQNTCGFIIYAIQVHGRRLQILQSLFIVGTYATPNSF